MSEIEKQREAEVQRLKTQYGEIFEVKVGDEVFLVKRPSRVVWKRFRAGVLEGGPKQLAAGETLVRDCCVQPTGDELNAVFDRLPATPEALTIALSELAGLPKDVGAIEKKAL